MTTQVEYLTPADAAAVAGMSRPAFLKHVTAGRILPAATIGSRDVFSRLAVERFRDERKKNGTKKRGPKPAKKK